MKKAVTIFVLSICLLTIMSVAAIAEMYVSRATMCSGIEDREPVGSADAFTSDVAQVYLFAEIMDAEDGSIIKHVWYHDGNKVFEIEITVNGPRWRTFSYKTINKDSVGKWKAEVTDADGNILKSLPFEVQ